MTDADPAYELIEEMRGLVAEQRGVLEEVQTLAGSRVAYHVLQALPHSIDRAVLMVGALVLAAVAGSAFASGYWMKESGPTVYGVGKAGFDQCTDRGDGWKVCTLSILVPTSAAKPAANRS